MDEYIKREAAIERLKKNLYASNPGSFSYLCFQDAINSVQEIPAADVEPVQEWIPVKDKLPPYNRDVLVYRPNMAMKFLVDNYEGYYGEDDDEWHEGWVRYGKDVHGNQVITHWSYLPQPPKGE